MKHAYLFLALLLGLLAGWPLAAQAQMLTTYQAEAGQLVAATTGTDRVGCTGRGTTGPT